MVVYVAADEPLPLIAWDKSAPAFHVRPIDKGKEAVRRQFSKPHVYYLGSHEGCGCGFTDVGSEIPDSPEGIATRQSLSDLITYLRQAIGDDGQVELFACWDREEGDEPRRRITVTPDEITGNSTDFDAKTFAVVENRPSATTIE